ncbi:MAG: serine/threonine protein kinase [Polyangiales bacterium]
MNPARSSELARGDAKLAACFEQRAFTFKRWLRRNDASHVAHVIEDGQELVIKVGLPLSMHNEFACTRDLQHHAILPPKEHLEGAAFSALLMPYFNGEPIVDAARRSVPRREAGLRNNLPMAFGYELNDLGESAFSHCGEEGQRLLRLWLATLGDALSYIHERKLLHLDIAPDNILVQGERCALLDFGLSGRDGEPRPEGALIGSAAYLAPELGLWRYSPAADWYSLGVVLFQALTGGLPFEGGGPEVLVRKQSMSAPRVSELCPEVAPDLDELCASWLTRDPKRRGDSTQLAALDPTP